MAKRFFLSTQLDQSAKADAISASLELRGWKRTFTWNVDDGSATDGHARKAIAELEGVRAADVLVVLLPGGRGTHVEIGAALALGKPVILHAPDRETLETPYACVFHYHPLVKILISQPLDVGAIVALIEE